MLLKEPIFNLLIAYIIGIVVGVYWLVSPNISYIFIACLLIIAIISWSKHKPVHFYFIIIIFLLGTVSFQLHNFHENKKANTPRWIGQIRQVFNHQLNQIMPSKEAAVLGSFLLGDEVAKLPAE